MGRSLTGWASLRALLRCLRPKTVRNGLEISQFASACAKNATRGYAPHPRPESLRMVWTKDGWKTTQTLPAAVSTAPDSPADIRPQPANVWPAIIYLALAGAETMARIERDAEDRVPGQLIYPRASRLRKGPRMHHDFQPPRISPFDRPSIEPCGCWPVDAVEKENSGHPGAPLGFSPIAYLLFHKLMSHNPAHSKWPDRDRFVRRTGTLPRCSTPRCTFPATTSPWTT